MFPPVQQKMVDLLSDGMAHRDVELHGCLADDLGPVRNIAAHLTAIRKKLRPLGQAILTERIDGCVYYRHVRILGNPYK